MRFIQSNQSEYGVAGVIEALLLVALFSIILSTIQLVYVPEFMEQREVDHMDVVENQFSYLKSIIDLQASIKETVPISSPITLGSRELPYLVTARAFGQLDIVDWTDSKIDTDFVSNIALTSITFQSANAYFIDQEYILEGGGVFVKQYNGESSRVEPSISYIVQTVPNQVSISWTLPEFFSIAGKNSTSGYKGCYIRSNYSSDTTHQGSTTYIRIYSEYLNAWNNTLQQIFSDPIDSGYLSIEKKPVASPTHIEISPGTKSLYIDLDVVRIGAQIGPGVIIES